MTDADSLDLRLQLDLLESLVPTSPEAIELISSILKNHRGALDNLTFQESQEFVDILDQAIAALQPGSQSYIRLLRGLGKICSSQAILPSSHFLSGALEKKTENPSEFGGFADVWEGTYENSRVAIKRFRIYEDTGSEQEKGMKRTFYKEVVIWKKLHHPNIVPVLGVPGLSARTSPFCIVSLWMPFGNLRKYVNLNPNTNRSLLLIDVCKGLHFLHSMHIVHGDLKGENILIDSSRRACLADFGLTSVINNFSTMFQATPAQAGTCRWMPPELLDPPEVSIPPHTASDIYSLSMVFIEAFTGKVPFREINREGPLIVQVLRGLRPNRPKECVEVADNMWALMERCWDRDKEQRPSISSVLDDLKLIALHALNEKLKTVDVNSFTAASAEALRTIFEEELTPDNPSFEGETPNIVLLLELVDRATRATVSPEFRSECLDTLTSFYIRFNQLAPSYALGMPLEFLQRKPITLGLSRDVWMGRCSDLLVAVKVHRFYLADTEERSRKVIWDQVLMWKLVSDTKHPRIVPFLGISNLPKPYTVSQWMEQGDLLGFLKAYPETCRPPLAIDVASGLTYLHSQTIVHGDLTGSHVLINHEKRACITGFERSFAMDRIPFGEIVVSSKSYRWTAPELLERDTLPFHAITTAYDIYSFSMVALQIFTTSVPFPAVHNDAAVVFRVLRGSRPSKADYKTQSGLTDTTWRLLVNCWQQNPAFRPSAASVLERLENVTDYDERQNLLPVLVRLDQIIHCPETDPTTAVARLAAFVDASSRTDVLLPSYLLKSGLTRLESAPAAGGAFSEVWRGTYGGRLVAIKVPNQLSSEDPLSSKMSFYKEAVLLKYLSHENIIPWLGVSKEHFPLSIVTEWIPNGNIRNYVQNHPEADRLALLRDVARGLDFMHKKMVTHGDLHGDNILITDSGRACIGGFTLAVPVGTPDSGQTGTGAMRWMAPELLSSETSDIPRQTPSSDVYSLSFVVIEIFTGEMPFPLLWDHTVALRISRGDRPERPKEAIKLGLSNELWGVVQAGWHSEPEKRPMAERFLKLNGLAVR